MLYMVCKVRVIKWSLCMRYRLWVMGYGCKIPANQLGKWKKVWVRREYGLCGVWVTRELTVNSDPFRDIVLILKERHRSLIRWAAKASVCNPFTSSYNLVKIKWGNMQPGGDCFHLGIGDGGQNVRDHWLAEYGDIGWKTATYWSCWVSLSM